MKIEIPTNCPECDSVLEIVNQQLFCRNSSCPVKTNKTILHYAKTVKIMGLGEKTLEKLNISNIADIYNLSLETLKTKLGEKIGQKIYDEIEKSKNISFSKFLSGMSIPLIGDTAAQKLATKVNSIDEINEETCKAAGLGPKAVDNVVKWVNSIGKYLELPIVFGEERVESGLSVCISGKVPGYTKEKIKEMLLDYNVFVKDNVTKDLDYLITEETGTTKVKKAEQYNIKIIKFNKFMEILNNE